MLPVTIIKTIIKKKKNVYTPVCTIYHLMYFFCGEQVSRKMLSVSTIFKFDTLYVSKHVLHML